MNVTSAWMVAALLTTSSGGNADVEQVAARSEGQAWLAVNRPEGLKPVLEKRRLTLVLLSFIPFGAVWGPVAVLRTPFDLDWALPSLVWSSVALLPFVLAWFPLGWLGIAAVYVAANWIASQTALANLNRPGIRAARGH